ncbi:MAG: cupin domain-containing protein [Synechococcales bacterium]|nr:cupin domain-containing protein [Synechococcales bacterium]
MLNNVEPCFCELAPLYALDVLEERDRVWVDHQIQELPELQAELQDFQLAVTAIAYATPPVPLAPALKSRLFDRLELTSPEQSAPEPVSIPDVAPLPDVAPSQPDLRQTLKTVRSQNLKWRAGRIAGVEIAVLHLDPKRREVTSLLRAEAGVVYPTHIHAQFEEIYMLFGDLRVGDQTYWAGDFLRSEQGSAHAPSTETGCMFIVRTSLDDEYPTPASQVLAH